MPIAAAPATSRAISLGVSGTCGVISRVGTMPVGASTMGAGESRVLSSVDTGRASRRPRRVQSPDHPCRVADHDGAVLDVLGRHGAGADQGAVADLHTGQHGRPGADEGPGGEADRSGQDGPRTGRRGEADLAVVAHRDRAVQVHLAADPGVRPDHGARVDVRPMAEPGRPGHDGGRVDDRLGSSYPAAGRPRRRLRGARPRRGRG